MPTSEFQELASAAHGLRYFSLVPSETDVLPPSALSPDLTSFLLGELPIVRRATGPFSADLTSRDDVIVAVLSLLLVLAIEGVVTACFLRTTNGAVSTFSFSVSQFDRLARDFKLHAIFRRRPRPRPANRPHQPKSRGSLNLRLIFVAVLVFTISFGLEVLVLFLTNPEERPVLNDAASFRIADPVSPDFDLVFGEAARLINPPCVAVSLQGQGVVQGNTSITACMSSDLVTNSFERFEVATEAVDVELRSDLHEFGIEHFVKIGDKVARYSARAYFSLGRSGKRRQESRLMRKSDMSLPREVTMAAVHKQFVAFLFTEYRNKTGDQNMSLERLRSIDFKFGTGIGPMEDIIVLNEGRRILRRPSRQYTTNFTAVIPQGMAALRFARPLFKASIAVQVSGPNERDLSMGSGSTIVAEGVVWLEEFRSLNWLSLILVLFFVLTLLVVLRCSLKPVVMSEMAGLYVAERLGTPGDNAAPLDLMARDDYFPVSFQPSQAVNREEWQHEETLIRARNGLLASDPGTSEDSLRRLY